MTDWFELALWRVVAGGIFLFLFFPLIIVVFVSINPDGFSFPPSGVTAEWYLSIAANSSLHRAFFLSLFIAVLTAVVTLPLVILAAVALRDDQIPGRDIIENAFYFPLVVPQVVIGLALLVYLTSFGILGSWLGILLGHIMITSPYALQTILAALKGVDESIEDASRDLGAGPLETLRYITIPRIKPAIIAGAGYVFILSFTNITLTIFLVGTQTVTVPVEIFQAISYTIDPAVSAIGTVLIFISVITVVYINHIFGVDRISGTKT